MRVYAYALRSTVDTVNAFRSAIDACNYVETIMPGNLATPSGQCQLQQFLNSRDYTDYLT